MFHVVCVLMYVVTKVATAACPRAPRNKLMIFLKKKRHLGNLLSNRPGPSRMKEQQAMKHTIAYVKSTIDYGTPQCWKIHGVLFGMVSKDIQQMSSRLITTFPTIIIVKWNGTKAQSSIEWRNRDLANRYPGGIWKKKTKSQKKQALDHYI